MCGIIGSINQQSQKFYTESLKSIAHRGPDDNDFFVKNNVFLGQTRLAIIDLSENGHQPMFSADGRYCIVFNGEIYNHIELREQCLPNICFKSTSDSETLLYLLIQLGVKCLNLLNGIFAFSFFDLRENEMLIARDQFGVKPLYYYLDSDKFIFSSEIKAILTCDNIAKDIDYKALVNYIQFLYSPGERTPFKSIKKLLPGNFISVQTNNIKTLRIVEYYNIPFNGQYFNYSEKEFIDKLDYLLECAVKRQLLADVPVGFFLSGGIDSSLIVAYARKLFPDRKIQCFTIDSGESAKKEGYDLDLFYAQQVAKYLNVDLKIVNADVDIVRDFDKMIYHIDEPQADPAPLSVYNISKIAKENGFKVLLGGTAGDDIFSGYQRHKVLKFERIFSLIPLIIRKFISRCTQSLNSNNNLLRIIRKATADLSLDKNERMKGLFCWFPLKENIQLFNKSIQKEIGNYNPADYFEKLNKQIPDETSDLNRMLFWELKTFLVDHNLNYTDKMGMAVGVEIRVPFLDKEIVEFSTKIPPSLKMKGVTAKYILKRVAERYLPTEVINRKKGGFGGPVRTWITGEMSQFVHERLSKESIMEDGIFNYDQIAVLIEDNKNGKIDAAYTIWSIMAIKSFLKQFK